MTLEKQNEDKILFSKVKPTSNLVKPDRDLLKVYMAEYSRYGLKHIIKVLEERLAQFHDVEYCVTFNSGFWALVQSVRLLANPSCKEVIIPSYAYRRLGALVSWCNKIPVFCDIERDTLALCPKSVRSQCSEDTSLIIGVHPVGAHVDIESLTQIANSHRIPIIFDSVESVKETHQGKILGGTGLLELYSLGASKLINGFEGGYITTNFSDINRKLRNSLNETSSPLYLDIPLAGINAVAALASLDQVDLNIAKNKARFDVYKKGLEQVSGIMLKEQDSTQNPSYKNIVIELLDNWPLSLSETLKILNSQNILARQNCPPITENMISYTHRKADLTNTNWAKRRFISMPCGYMTSEVDIEKIVQFLVRIQNKELNDICYNESI